MPAEVPGICETCFQTIYSGCQSFIAGGDGRNSTNYPMPNPTQDLRDKRMQAVTILTRMYAIIDQDPTGMPDWMDVRAMYQIRELRKEFLAFLGLGLD